MKVDANIGGQIDGSEGGDLPTLIDQLSTAEACGFNGVWSTEVGRDPFFPPLIAAEHTREMTVGTAVAVAFGRSPMTVASSAHDLQGFSGGRFVLGLGTQVKAHIERRYGMPWSRPTARMAEFIGALHAIWDSWESGDRLDFRGDFYNHTLMTPMFTPAHHPWGRPPVFLAAVGPRMTEVAASVADGIFIHGFTTERYLRETTLPLIEGTLDANRRDRASFVIAYPGMVATGASEEELLAGIAAVRHQIAFYGATPAYRSVLQLHGWEGLHEELHQLSVAGRWAEMDDLVDDDVLNAFAVVGGPSEVAAEISRRFGEVIDRFTLYTPYPLSAAARATVVAGIAAG
ncbi:MULTISPECIES: TIGR03617 family F420-dependent LLM class oxidoreductase [unclassified Nocardioides]|uniref:TIGR03617 family F420-dependent LLM class oxidoreductase n=1 Tax=unclassified Nocardioides TaxID=2615069 RepID=UPI0006FBC627|nr:MULTISPECIES: TIGR03617 family F420-dependent LLM class oxidoreductase [unclassified Nocardioides]KQY57247.1 LLM class F420-dependent oxidoreductase [Nocardioides sp. Root140]KQZ68762.1 LLM class F420-dependent oxidoreductase [Nocardioides sp. Root151]KRF11891.1 LLM class F420-dependent oxidoreductase [Nocardioides sp. Soil796]